MTDTTPAPFAAPTDYVPPDAVAPRTTVRVAVIRDGAAGKLHDVVELPPTLVFAWKAAGLVDDDAQAIEHAEQQRAGATP